MSTARGMAPQWGPHPPERPAWLHGDDVIHGGSTPVLLPPSVFLHGEVEAVAAVALRPRVEALERLAVVQVPAHVAVHEGRLGEEGLGAGQGL